MLYLNAPNLLCLRAAAMFEKYPAVTPENIEELLEMNTRYAPALAEAIPSLSFVGL